MTSQAIQLAVMAVRSRAVAMDNEDCHHRQDSHQYDHHVYR
jgi:hypothetical protein